MKSNIKRTFHLLSLIGLSITMAGCLAVNVSRQSTSAPPPVVTDASDAATIAEIDAAARLRMDDDRSSALGHLGERTALTVAAQIHLINVTYRLVRFEDNKTAVLKKIIARNDFGDAARHAIVSQLDKLAFDSSRQSVLRQLDERAQRPQMVLPSVVPAVTNVSTVTAPHTNTAIIPVPRTGAATNRQSVVLQRAKDNPGECDIAFIGDSITQGWEVAGKNIWTNYYGNRKCLNFGVGGDRTEHVLWRFEQGQLDGIKPRVAVVMIGTNNSNKNRDGTEQFSEADILAGVQAIVSQIRARLPDTKIILVAIFPRSSTFSTQRGKILQVNQALAKLDDGKMIHYVDFGSQMIEADGSISRAMMRDALHPGESGYEIWAAAIEPKLKEWLAQ